MREFNCADRKGSVTVRDGTTNDTAIPAVTEVDDRVGSLNHACSKRKSTFHTPKRLAQDSNSRTNGRLHPRDAATTGADRDDDGSSRGGTRQSRPEPVALSSAMAEVGKDAIIGWNRKETREPLSNNDGRPVVMTLNISESPTKRELWGLARSACLTKTSRVGGCLAVCDAPGARWLHRGMGNATTQRGNATTHSWSELAGWHGTGCRLVLASVCALVAGHPCSACANGWPG
jgi:hypothetical protein